MARGGGGVQMNMLYILIGRGGGANVQYLFESGGKCPPLIIIRGQMSTYTILQRGANVRGGKCPTLP